MFIQSKKFLPYNKDLNSRAKELRQNMTLSEKKLWYEYLRMHKHRFVRQKLVGNYILDFYCQKLKLGIEVDGETHFGDKNEKHDEKRTEELKKYGIEIIRFWNYEIMEGLEAVCERIENKIRTFL